MEGSQQEEKKSSVNYKGTPYEDASYSIIGEAPADEVFLPMSLSVIPRAQSTSDAMFRDYGGIDTEAQTSRWHLPEGIKHIAKETVENQQNEEERKVEEQRQHLEEIRAAAYEEGRQAALVEAQAQFEQHNQQINARMTELLRDMTKQLQERLALLERRSIQLSLDIAEKLVPQAVEINPEYIARILREALGFVGSSIIKQIRVSAEDKEFIDVVGLHKSIKEFDGTWEFVADETIRAGCVIETTAGEIEYDLTKGWQRIHDNVMKVLR